jgi:hypothetical protein
MRFFLTGPRFFGIRPGIILGPEDFRRPLTGPGTIQGSFLYVIQGAAGFVKIGVTTDPRARLAALQTGSPYPLAFVAIAATPGPGFDIEEAAHALLDSQRAEGEWFRVNPRLAMEAIAVAARGLGQPLLDVSLDRAEQILAIARDAPASSAPRPRLWPWIVGFLALVLGFYQAFTGTLG